MSTKRLEKIYKLRKHPDNPRVIKDVKYHLLVKSIKEFPEMLEKRPLVVNKDLIVLGGNMRLRAAEEAGLKEIWIDQTDWDEAKQKEFIIKDNSGFGEWDWDALANNWNSVELENWGVDNWQNMDDIETSNNFTLSDGDKEPFQQQTFTLADAQAEQIKNAIADVKKTEEYNYVETFGNENSNGNALYLIISQWVELKK